MYISGFDPPPVDSSLPSPVNVTVSVSPLVFITIGYSPSLIFLSPTIVTLKYPSNAFFILSLNINFNTPVLGLYSCPEKCLSEHTGLTSLKILGSVIVILSPGVILLGSLIL